MLRPLNNNVILKKEKVESKTASGIILTSVEEKKNEAVVVAAGTKCEELQAGMKVIFKEYSTTSFKDGEDEYLIISDEDILAIIE